MKRLSTLFLFLGGLFLTADAQSHKWEIGPFLGVSSYQGDLILTDFYDFQEAHFGYGFFLRHNLHPNISLRANLLRGKITGNDLEYEERISRGFQFSSPVTETSLQLEIDILGHQRFKDGKFKRIVSPYVFAGLGFAFLDQQTLYNEALDGEVQGRIERDRSADYDRAWFSVPFGAGIKADVSRRVTLGLEWGMRPVFSDLLDGVSQSGNNAKDDWYAFGGATVAYRFGDRDSDRDGVIDAKDRCPELPGRKSTKGCPDADNDGVVDSVDECPLISGPARLGGCPDTDKDGIIDKVDDCPDVAGILGKNGCPTKDTDNDGVDDDDDKCPSVAGLATLNGCPDSDGDGLADAEDGCPDAAGSRLLGGCPDSDGDGIIDKNDKCPELSGLAAGMGCPEITDREEDVLTFAARNVHFASSLARIEESSYAVLEEVYEIMNKYQQYDLMLEGYTDNRGNDFINQQLSDRRAKACKEFLVAKGIAENRISYAGYGEKKPIATNTIPEGRAMNRRVEFHLYQP